MVLLLGGVLAWGSTYLGDLGRTSTLKNGVQLIEFSKLNPSDQPLYKEIDMANSSEVILLARIVAPDKGVAVISVYGDGNDVSRTRYEVSRLEVVAGSWVRWEQRNPGTSLRLIISAPSQAGTTSATDLEIRAFLSPK